jgi:hypothetical protein
MTVEKRSVKPDNAQVVVTGSDEPEMPDGFGGRLVVATPNAVYIGTRPAGDGATDVRVADRASQDDLDPIGEAVWDGEIDVPDGKVKVTDIYGELILEWPDDVDARLRVRVFTDDPKSPGDVAIVLG